MKQHRSMILAITGFLVALAFVVVAEAQRLKVTQQCATSATRASTAILEVHLLEPSASASPSICDQMRSGIEGGSDAR